MIVDFILNLFRSSEKPSTMICVRQEDTWCWPDHLGKQTEGKCKQCDAAIYYEIQNQPFEKICNRCAGS